MRAITVCCVFVTVGFSLACAPVYAPGAASLAMMEEHGDVHIQGSGGVQGFQLDAAYAVAPQVAMRVNGQFQNLGGSAEGSRYAHVSAGASYFNAWDTGFRFSAGIDAGPTWALGVLSINNSTYALSGSGMKVSAPVELAFESDYFAFGGLIRPIVYSFTHDANSDADGTSLLALEETTLVVRAGAPNIKGELQMGLMVPLAVADDVNIGLPFPLIMSFGVVGNFNALEGKRKAASETAP